MKGVYFDYAILGNEQMSVEEKRIRERLQRHLSAVEILAELSQRQGLCKKGREKVTQKI